MILLDVDPPTDRDRAEPCGQKYKKCRRRIVGEVVYAVVIIVTTLAVMATVHYKLDNESFSSRQFDFNYTTNVSHLLPFNRSFSDYNVFLDGHSHTTMSDGRMTPEQLVQWGVASGYNAMVVTDHNTVEGGLRARKFARENYAGKLVIIPGQEYSCCRVHLNLINVEETMPQCGPSAKASDACSFPSDQQLREIIQYVKGKGGLVSVNHMYWSRSKDRGRQEATLPQHPTIEQLLSWGVDAFEIGHEGRLDFQVMARVERESKILLTGSDVHYPSGGQVYTVFRVDNLTEQAVFEALKKAPKSFIIDALAGGPDPNWTPNIPASYPALSPLKDFADYLMDILYHEDRGMYGFNGQFCHEHIVRVRWLAIAALIVYVVVFALVFVLFRHIVKYLWRERGPYKNPA